MNIEVKMAVALLHVVSFIASSVVSCLAGSAHFVCWRSAFAAVFVLSLHPSWAWKTRLESWRKCRSRNEKATFEGLQHKKSLWLSEQTLLLSCSSVWFSIPLDKITLGPEDMLNFHFWVCARQVKKSLDLGDFWRSSEQIFVSM